MPRLKKVLALTRLPINTFGSSSKFTTRRAEGSDFVFSMLRSLYFSEKKATSAPLTTKEKNSKARKRITNKVKP